MVYLCVTFHLCLDQRFAGVGDRAAMKGAIQDCIKMAFRKYSSELEDIHASYERNKVS